MAGNFNLRAIGFTQVLGTLSKLSNFDINSTYYVGTDVHYAAYVEFGTSRSQPQPFLRPAANETKANLGKHFGRGDPEAILKSVAVEVESKAKRKCPVDTGNLRGSIRTWKE